MRLRWAVLLLSAAALAKAPITHESMWSMKRVGPPAPSPDGRWVVFQLTEPDYDEKDQVSDLWIAPSDGSAPARRLTSTKGGESGAAWSPDSRRLAYAAKRDGDETNQIYVLDLAAGGEAQRVTSLSTGASSPRWRPDGKALLFTSRVYPEAAGDEANKKIAAERKARKYNARVYTGFPIRRWDQWIDELRPHLFVQPLEPGAKARDLFAGSKLAMAPGFGGSYTPTGGEGVHALWAPDGESIVFTATLNRDQGAYAFTDTHLFQVPAAGGEPRQLTQGEGEYSRPQFRPDGRALYCEFSPRTPMVYNEDRLVMFPWPAMGERTLVARDFDRPITSFAFTPDGATIYFLAEDAAHEKLYSVPSSGGVPRLALDAPQGVYTNLAIAARADSPRLFANWESATHPAELVRLDPAAGTHAYLTGFNLEAAAALDWQPVEEFWFISRGGKRIHNLLVKPPAFDAAKKYPLVVLMHGGPNSMWRDQFILRWNYHLLASPGYVVLLTNYTGSTGYGEKFAQAIQGDPLAGPAEEINEAADEAIRRFAFIDGMRQAAGGASYGGHLANWLEASTTRYKCLFSHAGLINLESQWGTSDVVYPREAASGGPPWEQGKVWREQNPIRFAKNFRTPMLLTVGERDFRVPLNQTLENWSALQRMRVPGKLIVFPEANHWISKGEDSRFFYRELLAWLAQHLN